MTTKINGTNTAASPAITGADTDTGLSFGTDTVNISTGGTTKATIDSSGNLIVTGDIALDGQTSPTSPIHIKDKTNDGYELRLSGNALSLNRDGASYIQQEGTGEIVFRMGSSNTERMRLDSVGCLQINQTSKQYSDLKFAVTGTNSNVAYFDVGGTGNNYGLTIKHGYAISGQNGVGLRFLNNSGTEVGKIDWGQSTTQYRTSSDYRLKENATAISDGITRLKTLKPYRFNWISEPDQPKVDGFFAHEVTAVPEAISGTKDEVDSNNDPVYQAIDQSKLVPLLTAALQEAITKIETLETKVAALEAG